MCSADIFVVCCSIGRLYILKDESSASFNFVLLSLEYCTAHTVKNLNIETEKSKQTMFVQISLPQYLDSVSTLMCIKVFRGLQHKTGPCRNVILKYILFDTLSL